MTHSLLGLVPLLAPHNHHLSTQISVFSDAFPGHFSEWSRVGPGCCQRLSPQLACNPNFGLAGFSPWSFPGQPPRLTPPLAILEEAKLTEIEEADRDERAVPAYYCNCSD